MDVSHHSGVTIRLGTRDPGPYAYCHLEPAGRPSEGQVPGAPALGRPNAPGMTGGPPG